MAKTALRTHITNIPFRIGSSLGKIRVKICPQPCLLYMYEVNRYVVLNDVFRICAFIKICNTPNEWNVLEWDGKPKQINKQKFVTQSSSETWTSYIYIEDFKKRPLVLFCYNSFSLIHLLVHIHMAALYMFYSDDSFSCSLYEWNILERDSKQQSINQSFSRTQRTPNYWKEFITVNRFNFKVQICHYALHKSIYAF